MKQEYQPLDRSIRLIGFGFIRDIRIIQSRYVGAVAAEPIARPWARKNTCKTF
jgi:hypothetical protein